MLPFMSGGASASCSFITMLIYSSFPGPEKKYPFIYILLVCEIVFSNFLSKSCVISGVVELTLICLVGDIGHIFSHVDCMYSRHLREVKQALLFVLASEDRVLRSCCEKIFSLRQTSEPNHNPSKSTVFVRTQIWLT